MLIKTNVVSLENTEELHGVSQKTGKEYNLKLIYVKDQEGLVYKILAPGNVFTKAEKGKAYRLVIYLDNQGKFSLNDIELQK